jgi:hypothetical protein
MNGTEDRLGRWIGKGGEQKMNIGKKKRRV